ncbi:MAG TPA: hypothetical protein VGL78_12360 [Solirubrobacteraceae bacterium]
MSDGAAVVARVSPRRVRLVGGAVLACRVVRVCRAVPVCGALVVRGALVVSGAPAVAASSGSIVGAVDRIL